MKWLLTATMALMVIGLMIPIQLDSAAPAAEGENPLLDSKSPAVNQEAPAEFKAQFETTKGTFVVEVNRDWAPRGADRFYNLVNNGYYDECRFFRVLTGFMAQIGIHGDPAVSKAWRTARILDDPVKRSNTRSYLSFATGGPNTRTSQFFINYGNNASLDRQGFSPFGRVIEGMEFVDALHAEYGEGAPRGGGPDQGRLQAEGNAYLKAEFPKLDYIVKATILIEEEAEKK